MKNKAVWTWYCDKPHKHAGGELSWTTPTHRTSGCPECGPQNDTERIVLLERQMKELMNHIYAEAH